MASRYGGLTNREPRTSLFDKFDQNRAASRSPGPGRPSSGYGNRYAGTPDNNTPYGPSGGASFSAYPNNAAPQTNGFHAGTPNSKGQYSLETLESLESQNDEQISGIIGKVGRLKNLTMQIGEEIRSSSTLADKMNDEFSSTRVRLKGTMTRMLRMAEKTGVGWRVWLGFFAAVILLFWYVWLF